jgi:hypothetical protein
VAEANVPVRTFTDEQAGAPSAAQNLSPQSLPAPLFPWLLASPPRTPHPAIAPQELHVIARILLTKKKFLDINRRAVSKRIKVPPYSIR